MAGIREVSTRAIHEDAHGRLWVGTTDGLMRLDSDGQVRLYAFRGVALHDIANIVEHQGALWIGLNIGVLRFRPELHVQGAAEPQKVILEPAEGCLRRDDDGRSTWTEAMLCRASGHDGLVSSAVTTLRPTSTGRLWIGTAVGLTYLDGTRFTTLSATAQIAAAGVSALIEDSAGQVWIGTFVGAFKLALDGMVSYGAEDGVGHPRVRRLLEDRDGSVYAVSGNWILNRFDGNRFHATKPQLPAGALVPYYSHAAFIDGTGQWWLLTERGLYRLRRRAKAEDAMRQPPEAIYDMTTGVAHDRVDRVFEDSRGDLWIASRSSQTRFNLSQWQRTSDTVRMFRDGFGAEHQFPMAFAEDREGGVWIGFESGGLARYHGGRFHVFGTADGVPPNVMALHTDTSGALWIASSSAGLSVIRNVAADRLEFQRFTTAHGLSSNNVQCLIDDEWGRLYLGTSRGVDRFDPSTGHVKHFGISEGLANDYVTTALRDHTGALWFGTTDGISRLIPVADRPSVAPPVWIGEVRAAGALLPVSELGTSEPPELTLSRDQNHLQIGFFGVAFGTGGPLRYRYRLEGADAEWTGPTTQRVVHFASLAPGSYRFVVEAVNVDGVVSEQPASVRFTVLPPVWQRAWVVSLAMALLVGAAVALHRLRVARIVAVERVRARIAADLHDDIGGTLSRIAIQSEVARRDLAETTGLAASRLAEIGDTARTVVESLADVVWSVDPVQDDLAAVERRVREYAADVLGPRGVRWTFHGTGHLERFALGPKARRDLLLLLKEGITNIARHAGARVASLHLRVVGGSLHAELRDDGCGFDPLTVEGAGAAQRHGLANMRMRAQQLGSRMTVESAPGAGTRIDVVVPLRLRRRMNMRLWRVGQ
jgi:signal transduction histidine kinase/ligand-binding sensor domain-containing protein